MPLTGDVSVLVVATPVITVVPVVAEVDVAALAQKPTPFVK